MISDGMRHIINGGTMPTYWEYTDEHPAQMPISEREAWHRDAWAREQDTLRELSNQLAGYDFADPNSFGFSDRGTAL